MNNNKTNIILKSLSYSTSINIHNRSQTLTLKFYGYRSISLRIPKTKTSKIHPFTLSSKYHTIYNILKVLVSSRQFSNNLNNNIPTCSQIEFAHSLLCKESYFCYVKTFSIMPKDSLQINSFQLAKMVQLASVILSNYFITFAKKQ